jgi:hypothetical protein
VILPFGDAHARAYQEKIDFISLWMTWKNKEQGINNKYYLIPMLFLNKHQKSVFFNRNCKIRPLLEVHSNKICEVRFGCLSFIFLTTILNTTQVFIAIPCIMIICPFSSSHFATQIFPIDELLKPYHIIEN